MHASTLPQLHDTKSLPLPITHPSRPFARTRTSLVLNVLALFAMFSICAYTIFIACPISLSQPRFFDPAYQPPGLTIHPLQHIRPTKSSNPKRPQITLSPTEELAAVTSFIASHAANVIPSTVNPDQPIDPDLVLDFDIRSPRAGEEVEAMIEDVWTRHPVVLYAKHFSPVSRSLKSTISALDLRPSVTFIDVDTRDDAPILTPLLHRLTSSPDLPVLLIGGKTLPQLDLGLANDVDKSGLAEHVKHLVDTGELQHVVEDAGAVVGGARKPGKKRVAGNARSYS